MLRNVWLVLLPPYFTFAQPTSTAPVVGGCSVFPADNIWNTPIDQLPVAENSGDYIAAIGRNTGLHPDFGSGIWDGAPIGIPYIVVPANQPLTQMVYTAYGDESDAGPFPIPAGAPVEGGSNSDGDRHVLVIQQGKCHLYELYRA